MEKEWKNYKLFFLELIPPHPKTNFPYSRQCSNALSFGIIRVRLPWERIKNRLYIGKCFCKRLQDKLLQVI